MKSKTILGADGATKMRQITVGIHGKGGEAGIKARAGRTQQASWGRLRRWKMQRALARRVILYMMITARRYIPQRGSRQAQAFRLAYR